MFIILLGNLSCQKKESSAIETQNTKTSKPSILFLGDSLTAGYGIDPDQAYPALIQEKLDKETLSYAVYNAGESGITSLDGLNRTEWHMESKPAVLVLALGANDGLRGIAPAVTKKNLKGIIELVQKVDQNTKILFIGMKAPPNMGEKFTKEFELIFSSLAKEYKLDFIPFLLEGVAAQPKLNLPDGIHPNPEGQKIMAELVWEKLKKML